FGGMPLWFILIAGIAGIYICDSGEKTLGVHDASEIVYDEWIGMWIAMWNVPLILTPVAFALFRLFDISKVGPIGKIQDLNGGLGIMADDVLAGIISRIIIAVPIYFFF
ncbi:MAG: phosphatidylglycerophosphatase A, partial [Peptococcaceae bacterium]|nr:phosphatidylglycerophosphatase A [Peptococcaceae bacterium]